MCCIPSLALCEWLEFWVDKMDTVPALMAFMIYKGRETSKGWIVVTELREMLSPMIPPCPQRLHLAQGWMAQWYWRYPCPESIFLFFLQTFAEPLLYVVLNDLCPRLC